MADLAEFKSPPRTETLTVRGIEINLTFDPDVVTPALEAKLAAAGDEEQARVSAQMLADLVIEWDLTKDGAPYPTDFDSVKELPVVFLGDLMLAIGASIAPKEAGKV